ncbi:MAG: GntR family transcriptional regulator [Acidobacteria bacterium]|nr:GntR family transcriptional regulator [Acidobacteriota bacterium]
MDYGGNVFTGEGPIFQQLAAQIADDIVSGLYPEESAVPSATDFAEFYRMNPATASKGVNMLVELGALYKRRGIGMFVSAGARDLLLARRRDEFRTLYVRPLLREAGVLAISTADLHSMIDEPYKEPT